VSASAAGAPGRRRRVLDGFVGAVLLLVVLVVLVAVAFWVLSRPAGSEAAPDPGPSPSASATPAEPPEPTAPADLGPDETWLGAVDLGSPDLVSPDGRLLDVVATAQGVRSGPDGLTAERLRLEATVPFSDVAALLAEDATVSQGEQGLAELRRTVTVLGRTLDVRATATVRAEDGLIVVEPQEIDLGGPDFLAEAAGTAVRELVTIRRPVEGVPPGLELEEVTVQQDGFRTRFTGRDVRLGD
jgi:hypothetical protein